MADGLRTLPSLAAGRHVADAADQAAGPGGRGRAHHVGGERRLHDLPGSSARRSARRDGRDQKEPPVGVHVEPEDHGWAGPEEAVPPRSTWLANKASGRCPSWSPPDSAATALSSQLFWNVSESRASGRAVPCPATADAGRQGVFIPRQPGPTCESAGSGPPSPSRPTRSATASDEERPADGLIAATRLKRARGGHTDGHSVLRRPQRERRPRRPPVRGRFVHADQRPQRLRQHPQARSPVTPHPVRQQRGKSPRLYTHYGKTSCWCVPA
jgi:hypothetical protein